jgi:hypothetical protein
MQESAACAVLKARFEAAGFRIVENRMFDEDGIRFEMDGFDPDRRVGYEYVTEEAGDSWDVDDSVKTALAERKDKGELFILVVEESEAPDEKALCEKADAFLAELPADDDGDDDEDDDDDKPAAKKPAAKKPAAKKPAAKKPAAKKPAKKKKR